MKIIITTLILSIFASSLFSADNYIKLGVYQTVEAHKPISQYKTSINAATITKIDGVELKKTIGVHFKPVEYFNLYFDLSRLKNNDRKKIIAKGFFTYKYIGLPSMPKKDWPFGSVQAMFQRVLFFNVAIFIEPLSLATKYETLKIKKLKEYRVRFGLNK